ncbi:MAG: hypothetical protein M3328_08600 [Chloroflexota bacterium]|nr:hypothetical protein [Chloroflexota bacterium]
MDRERLQRKWAELAEEAFTGMAEWRVQHPKATFREIEAAVDERLAAVRARMLEDAALASAATEFEGSECPQCSQKLKNAGMQSRTLLTHHNKQVQLQRRYGPPLRSVVPAVERGFSPWMRS